jgi:hypothetical protein
MILFHPIEIFYLIKRDRKNIPWMVSLFTLAIAVLIKTLTVYTVNYTVASKSAEQANALWELGMVVVPLLLWVVASYALMTIMGGESTFKETLTISTYSLVPYILFTPLVIIISQVLSTSEAGFFNTLQNLLIVWMLILLFVGFKESNGLGFGAAIWRAFLSLIVMVLIAATFLLIFALGSQIVIFVQELTSEINYYLR